jgi:hypothetical protein
MNTRLEEAAAAYRTSLDGLRKMRGEVEAAKAALEKAKLRCEAASEAMRKGEEIHEQSKKTLFDAAEQKV